MPLRQTPPRASHQWRGLKPGAGAEAGPGAEAGAGVEAGAGPLVGAPLVAGVSDFAAAASALASWWCWRRLGPRCSRSSLSSLPSAKIVFDGASIIVMLRPS